MSPKARQVLGEPAAVPHHAPKETRKKDASGSVVGAAKREPQKQEWSQASSGSLVQARQVRQNAGNLKLGQVRKRKSRRVSKMPTQNTFRVGDRAWAEYVEDGLWYRAEIVAEDVGAH